MIPEMRDNLFELFSAQPLFFEGDFKTVLNRIYQSVSRSTRRFLSDTVLYSDEKSEGEIISSVTIDLNRDFLVHSANLTTETEKGPKKKSIAVSDLISLLGRLQLKKMVSLYPDLVVLYNLWVFTLKILEKGAFIPQLLHLREGKYRIRWIPAILNIEVKAIVDNLSDLIPPDIVRFRQTGGSNDHHKMLYQSSREQLNTIIALFADHLFTQFGLFDRMESRYAFSQTSRKVLELFLLEKTVTFRTFEERELPNTIQLWLNKFYVTHKDYIPIVKVDADDHCFSVSLLVECRNKSFDEPVTLKHFLSDQKYKEVKFDVLRDLSLLSEHFLQLKEVIRTEGNKKLVFDSAEFAELLLQILPTVRMIGIPIMLPKALKSLVTPRISLRLEAQTPQGSVSRLNLESMLKFNWKIAIGDELIDAEQFVLIDQEEIDRLLKNLKEPPALSSMGLLKSALTEEYGDAKIGLSQDARELIEKILNIEKVDPPDVMGSILRQYQTRGYEWMVKNAKLGFGSLIADDMGLGKTVQVLAVLLKFKQEGHLQDKKTLIVVPTTLITNWLKEIEKFTPELKPFVYHGQGRCYDPVESDLVITSYGIVRSEASTFQRTQWHVIVIDEAQNIKNPKTAQTKAVKKLKSDVKIAMSGTPVENRLSECWSILDFANKGYLGSLKHFNDEFAKPIQMYHDQKKIDLFRKMSSPFLLRRLKTDKRIIQDLPDKIENNQYCSLTKEQAAIYQNVVGNMMAEIESQEGIARRGMILKLMTALKQICNHPYHFLKRGKRDSTLSGKTLLLLSILDTIWENGEKVLIFTQYRKMGDLLEHFIEERYGARPLFLHGGTSRKRRDEMVDGFHNERHIRTFILSLKAGGTGLNLTAANNVVHYDLWWNPAVENQATDRAYRIGQKKNVMVYRLLTKGTFEEKIDEMLKDKKALAQLTVASNEKWIGEFSNSELKSLVELR
jgi:SNF2 family DNA or RNA helicase